MSKKLFLSFNPQGMILDNIDTYCTLIISTSPIANEYGESLRNHSMY